MTAILELVWEEWVASAAAVWEDFKETQAKFLRCSSAEEEAERTSAAFPSEEWEEAWVVAFPVWAQEERAEMEALLLKWADIRSVSIVFSTNESF